jgi:hypothetical protein
MEEPDMTSPSVVVILASVIALAPRSAAAQAAAPPLAQLVERGEKVVVVDDDGQEIEGRIESITSTILALRVQGRPVDVAIDRVVRVDRPRDGLGNGALIGMGTTVSLSMIGIIAAQNSCHHGHYACAPPPAWVVLWAAGSSAALGAGIGVAIDAMIHSERAIYRRGGVRAAISPTIVRGVRGASVSVSW